MVQLVKQKMQTGLFTSTQAAVRKIEGVRGLYADFASFQPRDLPYVAFGFCIYEQWKLRYGRRNTIVEDISLYYRRCNNREPMRGIMAFMIVLRRSSVKRVLPGTLFEDLVDCAWRLHFFGALGKPKDLMEERSLRGLLLRQLGVNDEVRHWNVTTI